MAFALSRMFMKYNLLNTSLFASCMCKVERHKSIEDQWKLVYWFFNAVIHFTTPITREEASFQGKPKYVLRPNLVGCLVTLFNAFLVFTIQIQNPVCGLQSRLMFFQSSNPQIFCVKNTIISSPTSIFLQEEKPTRTKMEK